MAAIGKVTLRNYRCFDWENPAILEFGNGFTALVGPNNSGKSAALRSIYELRSVWASFVATINPQNGYVLNAAPSGVADVAELANDHAPESFEIAIEINETQRSQKGSAFLVIGIVLQYAIKDQRLTAKQVRAVDAGGNVKTYSSQDLRTSSGLTGELLSGYSNGTQLDYSALHQFGQDLYSSRYFPAFRNAINEGAGTYYDIPVGTALVHSWDQWKAGNSRANKIAISQVEAEIATLLGFRSLQINADQTGKTLDVIVNGRPQKLYEVGAGVAQLIIVLAAALVHKAPYILIDEPELSLHPSLQLNFLSTLGSYSQKGILYATHSIGLARSTAQRIFTVQKIADGRSRMRPFGERHTNFVEWLGELSYSDRAELGCEGLILVEGPSEILCFQEFLRKLNKDHKYVLMQLGGSSLINAGIARHLTELMRLVDSSHIHIFIDSERKSSAETLAADRAAFLAECNALNVNAVASERRATENYFEINGIRKALGVGYQPLEPYQKLSEAVRPWAKSDNWKIAKETSMADIQDTDFGRFLNAL